MAECSVTRYGCQLGFMQRQKLSFCLTDFPPQAAAQPLTHDHLGKRRRRGVCGVGGVTKKTFADTWIPQDAYLIFCSAFIFFLTLILTRPYKFISVLLCPLCFGYTAERQLRCVTLPITFRKKERVSLHVDGQEKCEISIKDAIRMSERKKGPECHRPDGDAAPQLCSVHRGVDGFKSSLSGPHLPPNLPFKPLFFQMYSLWVTARYNPHDAPPSFEELFSSLKGCGAGFSDAFSPLECDTVLCNTLTGLSHTLVFLRRDVSGEFLLMYKKQANVILFHALPELETALECFLSVENLTLLI